MLRNTIAIVSAVLAISAVSLAAADMGPMEDGSNYGGSDAPSPFYARDGHAHNAPAAVKRCGGCGGSGCGSCGGWGGWGFGHPWGGVFPCGCF
ncbi:hypothetical protein GGI11_002837 [Coemansia sp. RSA 2049]|nr:hypothetical protein GGI11_002837 [Coemansia sp. RSA 2049]KAJ2522246.1 hypothetical protein H4217_000889 [Coemansia sp. RSA 1939]